MLSDGELLRDYVENRSESAFAELVQRHLNVVYRAALRRVGGNAHAADDVTQKLFTDLARKARTLVDRPSLAGWLHAGTRFAAADVVHAEQRRHAHEREAHAMNELLSPAPVAWARLEPLLDSVIDLLPEPDREAVLLHFFEGRSFVEIGALLSLSADAARMRVNRALDRLRTTLEQRGVASTSAALTEVLLTQAVIAVPTPSALLVARRAIGDTAALHHGTSVLTRCIDTARSSSFASWAGGALLLGLAGLAVYSFQPPGAPTLPPTAARPTIDAVRPASPASAAAAPTLPTTSQPSGEPASAASATGLPAVASEFAALSAAEQNILVLLWRDQTMYPSVPGRRWGINVAPDAPNFNRFIDGRRLLRLKGWVAIGRQKRLTFLTADGLAFCAEHRSELEALPRFKEISSPAEQVASDGDR